MHSMYSKVGEIRSFKRFRDKMLQVFFLLLANIPKGTNPEKSMNLLIFPVEKA